MRLDVKLLEDLHSGTGVGAGAIDALQIRDRGGHPTIRASHVKGLLRDAAQELVDLGEAKSPEVDNLFGSARQRRGALLMESLRVNGGNGKLLNWSSTARGLFDRGPRDDTLRTAQFVGAGTEFSARVELRDPALKDLLEYCLRHTQRLGAYRSRGSGLIKADLKHDGKKAYGAIIDQPGAQSTRLRLVLTNPEPACLPATGTPDNIIRTECYIRGQALFGALAYWGIINNEAGLDDLFSGTITMGNAYPLPLGKQAAVGVVAAKHWEVLPIPLDTATRKPEPQSHGDWPWWAEDASAAPAADDGEDKPKRPGDREFIFRNKVGESWWRYEPSISVHLRNDAGAQRRSDVAPSAADNEQNLFSTEEIAEDTLFLADLTFEDQGAAQRFLNCFRPVLEGRSWLAIGRGGTPLEVSAAIWTEQRKHPQALRPGEALVLRLTSDLIARGPYLGFYDDLDAGVVIDLAVKDADERERLRKIEWQSDLLKVDNPRTISDNVMVHGFNAASGLPRAPALAIRRGSCLVLSGPEGEVAKLYGHLARKRSLGERTHEGFGQFRLDLAAIAPPAKRTVTLAHDQTVTRHEALLAAAERAGARLLAGADGNTKRGPSVSQWMALWNEIQTAKSVADINNAFTAFKYQGKKQGGRAWGTVAFKVLEDEIETQQGRALKDAVFFLDAVIGKRVSALLRERRRGD